MNIPQIWLDLAEKSRNSAHEHFKNAMNCTHEIEQRLFLALGNSANDYAAHCEETALKFQKRIALKN